MAKISACIIAKNEERTISRALTSLKKFADEIVVIDSHSTDKTAELARSFGAKVIASDWKGFAHQRNVGLDHCSNEWVFFLDADEEASLELGVRLKKIAAEPTASHPNCYSVTRYEYFLGKELHYGPGNPSYQWRFFKRHGVRFEGEVHEYPRFEGPVGEVREPIRHNPDLSVDRFLNKLNHYTSLEAIDRFSQGQRTTLFHAFGTFFTTMLKNGIRYRGFLNGKEGVVLTILESFSRVVRHLKLWTLWQVYDGKIRMNLGFDLPKPGSAKPPTKEELDKPVWKS